MQARLREELLGLGSLFNNSNNTSTTTETNDIRGIGQPPSIPASMPSPQDIDSLPILHAVVMETLRLHPAIPGGQPRSTPSPSCTLAGYANIPGGMRVNAQAYSLHRNEAAFPRPEEWLPERWLGEVEGEYEKKERWFWAFGSGGRMCIGSNFAMTCEFFSFSFVFCRVFLEKWQMSLGYTKLMISHKHSEQGHLGSNL
jgi:cytochrome P450